MGNKRNTFYYERKYRNKYSDAHVISPERDSSFSQKLSHYFSTRVIRRETVEEREHGGGRRMGESGRAGRE